MTAWHRIDRLSTWAQDILAEESWYSARLRYIATSQGWWKPYLLYCLSGPTALATKARLLGEPTELSPHEPRALLHTSLRAPWENVFVVRRQDVRELLPRHVRLYQHGGAVVLTESLDIDIDGAHATRELEPLHRPVGTVLLTAGRIPFWREVAAPAAAPEPLPRVVRHRGQPTPFYAFPHQLQESA